MGRRKKTSADFKNEIADLVDPLGDGGEHRVRDAFRKYRNIEMQKSCRQKSLTAKQTQCLNTLRADYLIGRKLDELDKKLRNAKKKENKTNPPSAAAVTNLATSTPITNRVTTHQSRPTTYVNPLASTHVALFMFYCHPTHFSRNGWYTRTSRSC